MLDKLLSCGHLPLVITILYSLTQPPVPKMIEEKEIQKQTSPTITGHVCLSS